MNVQTENIASLVSDAEPDDEQIPSYLWSPNNQTIAYTKSWSSIKDNRNKIYELSNPGNEKKTLRVKIGSDLRDGVLLVAWEKYFKF